MKVKTRDLIGPALQKYTWPGGHPLYLVCADGGVLCTDCARKEWRLVSRATRHPGTDRQWEIVGVAINWEDESVFCDHCGTQIEYAYGSD